MFIIIILRRSQSENQRKLKERQKLVLYRHLHNHNDTIIKTDAGRLFLTKYLPLTLLQGFEKGYSRFACERELETEQNWNILTPTLMAINVVSFSFSWCSTRGPGVHSAGWWLSLLHLISNFSGPQTPSGLPRAPSARCCFPYHTSSIIPFPTVLELKLNCLVFCLDWVI